MIIYMIINKINKKRYIGQTISTLKLRFKAHCYFYSNNKNMPIVKAIKKYGKENFEIKILSRCNSIKEMNRREEYYIKLFKTLTPTGYNVRIGGLNSKHNEKTKEKMSKSHKGKSPTISHRENLSKALTGIPLSYERRENIRIAFWKSPSAHTRIDRLIKEGLKAAKSIFCHQNGKIYRSIHEAAKELNLQRQHIKGTIEGKSKLTKGYSFEYYKV